jgi:hypothetical protein
MFSLQRGWVPVAWGRRFNKWRVFDVSRIWHWFAFLFALSGDRNAGRV